MTDTLDINNLPKPWTRKQYLFALNYLETKNATEAAKKAGYSHKSAKTVGNQNMTKPHISEFISKRLDKIAKKLEITPERIMEELGKIAFNNLGDFLSIQEDGTALIDMSVATPEQLAALEQYEVTYMPSVEVVENGEEVSKEVLKIKIKHHNKLDALDKLMKKLGMYAPEKREHSGTVKVERSDEDLARRMAFILAKGAKDAEKTKKDTKINKKTEKKEKK